MVLQQNAYAAIWGRANPGEQIVVAGSWDQSSLSTFADSKGKWLVQIPTPEAGGPFSVTIKGENTIILSDVLVGEVWVASGQSNMAWPLSRSEGGAEEILESERPEVRFFIVERELSTTPRFNCEGKWEKSSPETAGHFSGVAYYFAKKLQENLQIPIGIIQTAWGGSSAQAWISRQFLEEEADFQPLLTQYDQAVSTHRASGKGPKPVTHRSPSTLYNGMLAPLIPFTMRGVIWYQGEYNRNDPYLYKKLFPHLIQSWRRYWGLRFPFYYVQIAPFNYPNPLSGTGVREAQRLTLSVPNTEMVVSMDVGNPHDIHPRKKEPIGTRLALCALANNYGFDGMVHAGPLYVRTERLAGKLKLYFEDTGSGLMIKGNPLTHMEIAGEDHQFYPAEAEIDGHTLILYSQEVPNPIAARYGFEDAAEPNLFNKEGFPASSFRTDDWPLFFTPPLIQSKYERETDDFSVEISYAGSEPHQLYYTLDGTDPDVNSQFYKGTFITPATSSKTIKVRAANELILDKRIVQQTLFLSKAVKGAIISQTKADRNFSESSPPAVIDGIQASTNPNDVAWQGYRGKDIEVIIDLGKKQNFEVVKMHFLRIMDNGILLPEKVEFSFSNNGRKYKNEDIGFEKEQTQVNLLKKIPFNSTVKSRKARYIKITAKNPGPIPDEQKDVGRKSWMYLDEIIVK